MIPIQSVSILKPSIRARIGIIKTSSTFCNTPNLCKIKATAATIATITTVSKKIGFISICSPSFMKAIPKFFTVPPSPFRALLISSFPKLPMVATKSSDFLFASSKSKLIRDLLILPKPLPTASNFEPVANILTCSLASLILSDSTPAALDNLAISAGSVAFISCPFKSFSSALTAASPPILRGISTSFICLRLVVFNFYCRII